MPIYTKTGDKGKTSLFGGKRIGKSHPQVESYGTVDELTSFIGLISSKLKNKKDRLFLIEIQMDLWKIMAVLSGTKKDLSNLSKRVLVFEKRIDGLEKKLPKLRRFILPGGTELSSWFHVLRVICRRTERSVVRLNKESIIIQYLNRLSDLFFVMARWYGKGKEINTRT